MAGNDFECITYVHKKKSIILSKPIEKSTVAFCCNIKCLDLKKAIIWHYSRSKSQNGQSVSRNLFSKYISYHLAFRRSQVSDIFSVDRKLKSVT